MLILNTLNCVECGAEFTPSRNDCRRKFCSAICREKNERRAEQTRRRARKTGVAADRIDPIEVFNKYGWRCYLCGISTPREMCGTNDARAPTLDHIVPLGLGGTHTESNVACACRDCNTRKSDKMPKQHPLGLHLDSLVIHRSNPRRINSECMKCGKAFVYPQGARGPLRKYCSTACKDSYSHKKQAQKLTEYRCDQCGASLNALQARTGARYCSHKCFHLSTRLLDCKCAACGAVFKPRYQGQKCCSMKCSVVERSKIRKELAIYASART